MNDLTTELLLLPDGRILVQNLTPVFAALLAELNPDDEQIAPRTNIGARVCDPQQPAIEQSVQTISTTPSSSDVLRLTEPRSVPDKSVERLLPGFTLP